MVDLSPVHGVVDNYICMNTASRALLQNYTNFLTRITIRVRKFVYSHLRLEVMAQIALSMSGLDIIATEVSEDSGTCGSAYHVAVHT